MGHSLLPRPYALRTSTPRLWHGLDASGSWSLHLSGLSPLPRSKNPAYIPGNDWLMAIEVEQSSKRTTIIELVMAQLNLVTRSCAAAAL